LFETGQETRDIESCEVGGIGGSWVGCEGHLVWSYLKTADSGVDTTEENREAYFGPRFSAMVERGERGADG
jgi:hypothetical protein